MIPVVLVQRPARALSFKRGSSGAFSLSPPYVADPVLRLFSHLILSDALQAAGNITSFHRGSH